ncbi:MAG TPA: aquaporin [Thermoplasmata archaeon]|nr:aquaporin [Thermoplasmata archaeon]
MRWTPAQKYVAEFLGTFGLLVAVTGAALFSLNMSGVDGTARFLVIALSIGLGLIGLLYALADISGGHYNPAITVGVWAAGRMPTRDVVPYVLAQVAGALVGVATMAGVAHGSPALWSTVIHNNVALASEGYQGNGSPYGVAMGSVFLLEVVMTFLFVQAVLYSTRAGASAGNLAPVSIGFTLIMIHLVSLGIDGTSVNPARSFAPAILSSGISGDHWAIAQDWLFWVAPIVGALIAALVERFLREKAA